MVFLKLLFLLCVTQLQTILAAPASETANIARVLVRVEGQNRTYVQQWVDVSPGYIRARNDDQFRRCDLTARQGEDRSPGPSLTRAIYIALQNKGIGFDAEWYAPRSEYTITTVDKEMEDMSIRPSKYWTTWLNNDPTRFGCQQPIKTGDEVLFGFDMDRKVKFLKLRALEGLTVRQGGSLLFEVRDVKMGKFDVVPNAIVNGFPTDARGRVRLTFRTLGRNTIKATREGELRSAGVEVVVTA